MSQIGYEHFTESHSSPWKSICLLKQPPVEPSTFYKPETGRLEALDKYELQSVLWGQGWGDVAQCSTAARLVIGRRSTAIENRRVCAPRHSSAQRYDSQPDVDGPLAALAQAAAAQGKLTNSKIPPTTNDPEEARWSVLDQGESQV